MVQTFPMALADFFDGFPVKGFKPDLTESMEYSRSKGGEIFTADNGPRLWTMDLVSTPGYHGRIEQIKARLQLLRSPARSLLIPSMPLLYPQKDPKGTILGASSITLKAVAGNNREITLGGFPVGYRLTPGDFMSFTYGSNPLRYGMHQFVSAGVANIDGDMVNIEVVDFIRPGFTIGAAVRIIKPLFKAVVIPGSTEVMDSDAMTSGGVKFTVLQTLR